jgi:hypothetical protein
MPASDKQPDVNDLFANISSKPADTLSHYTSLDGFRSIIEHSELWASNISFLNDRQEMSFGLDVARDFIENISNKPENKKYKGRLKFVPSATLPDVYACCFCKEPDMLSQWRGYGSATQSVSIQFDANGLREISEFLKHRIVEIVYGRQNSFSFLQNTLGKKPDLYFEFFEELMGSDPNEAISDIIYQLAPVFKNEHFREEREWRIVSGVSNNHEVRHRVRDNVIIPYIRLHATDGLPIVKVTIGPGKDTDLTIRSVESFLKSHKKYQDVVVTKSEIPFRT